MVQTQLAEAYGLAFETPALDTGVGACLRDFGEFARPELDFILAHCAGDFVDVGANLGAICLPFAKERPQAQVVAVEAHPGLADLLRSNVGRNSLSNVVVVEAAAAERTALIDANVSSLDVEANHGASSLFFLQGGEVQRLKAVALDSVAPAGTRFVKVDVEGFEPRVLQGAPRLLRDTRPTWLVEVAKARPNTTSAVMETLRGHRYNLFWFFSPFVTRRRPRGLEARVKLRGDLAIVATDEESAWDLLPVGEEWPSDVSDFPYLASYGLVGAHS